MKPLYFAIACILLSTLAAGAQVRPAEKDDTPTAASAATEARYMGGMFGFDEKESGTLQFDDENRRIVFFGKDKKEKFALNYDAVLVVEPRSQSVTSNTGNVVRNIPLPGSMLGGLIKEKHRYMIIQFSDPDVDVRGTVSFKLSSKALLDSVIRSLGEKAKLTKRGEAYYRPRTVRTEI